MSVSTTPGRGPAARAQAPGTRAKKRRRSLSSHPLASAVFLSPALLVIIAFVLIPMILTLWISLHQWSMFTPIGDMDWVGMQNYQDVLTDSTHQSAFVNTLIYVGLSVLITVPLATILAILLYFPKLAGRGLVRVLLFSTYVVPTVAIVIIWSNLYSPDYGPIDTVLGWFGISSPGWLSNPSSALFSLVVFNVWQMLGYYVVLLVAGLTQIPEQVYEAARLDGAGVIRQTFSVTIPLLRSSLFFVVLMTVINSVQVFDPVYLLTQGGPVGSTNVLSFDIQRTAFQYGLAGQASAMAFSVLLVVAIVGGTIGLGMRRRA